MAQYRYDISEQTSIIPKALQTGLRSNIHNPRNYPALIKSDGMYFDSGSLRTLDDIDTLDLGDIVCEFPFPQFFHLIRFDLVCTETTVYTLSGSTLTLAITVDAGTLWSVADFGAYVIMTNGQTLVQYDPDSGEWSEYVGYAIPNGICLCNLNGQLIIGGPEVTVSAGFLGE